MASAMVVRSSTSRTFSATWPNTRLISQLSSLRQSAQRRYAIRLKHGSGAIGPSRMRKDLPKGDAVGGDEQVITAEPAAPALHDAVALKFEQDLLEEFARDLLVGGDLADHQQLLAPRQRHQRMEGVFGSL